MVYSNYIEIYTTEPKDGIFTQKARMRKLCENFVDGTAGLLRDRPIRDKSLFFIKIKSGQNLIRANQKMADFPAHEYAKKRVSRINFQINFGKNKLGSIRNSPD